MKNWKKMLFSASGVLLLAACNNEAEELPEEDQTSEVEETPSVEENTIEEEVVDTPEENEEAEDNVTEDTSEVEEGVLANYSEQEIEYARVWLSVRGEETDHLESLYFQELPEGTPVLLDDEEGPVYPEDVHRLSGVRQVDGSVVYSGNGDGTINLYMDRVNSTEVVEDFSQEMVEDTQLVEVDVHEDEKVAEIIELLIAYDEEYQNIEE
jgi:hypothetical protein